METSQTLAKESQDNLHQQFKNLEQQWDTIKQTKPHPHQPTLHRCSMDSKTIVKTLQLINNSPKSLMSSLQHERRSPSVEEILRERRMATESSKLKGRRLFEMGFEGREEMGSDCFGLVQEGEVRSVCSYGNSQDVESDGLGSFKEEVASGCCYCCSYSGSSVSGGKVEREKVADEREKVEHDVEEKERYGGGGSGGGKWILLMAWFSIALMVFTLGIISMKCNEEYGNEDEVIVVPT
ncbi:uncharacterized protein LOC132281137 [Cornus florida]|uniref:uncharacterized protein LOC132281137 n=1 Tax=Cornus florida TaxID=4283 RepID=UPI00289865E8|nr:uncharacterized protein LOC132281137 [Cornus florida]